MQETANKNRDAIQSIRKRLLQGVIDYDQAQDEAKPIIEAMNVAGNKIAKEHGMPYKKLSFNSLMR